MVTNTKAVSHNLPTLTTFTYLLVPMDQHFKKITNVSLEGFLNLEALTFQGLGLKRVGLNEPSNTQGHWV